MDIKGGRDRENEGRKKGRGKWESSRIVEGWAARNSETPFLCPEGKTESALLAFPSASQLSGPCMHYTTLHYTIRRTYVLCH